MQEEVNRWRELNCAADFTELAAALNPLIQSLALVLHHQVACNPFCLCDLQSCCRIKSMIDAMSED